MRHTTYGSVLGRISVLVALVATGACDRNVTLVQPAETMAAHGFQEGGSAPGSAAFNSQEVECRFERPRYHGLVYREPENMVPPIIFEARQVVDMWGPPPSIILDLHDDILWTCTPDDPAAFPAIASGPSVIPTPDPRFRLMSFPTIHAPGGAWFLTFPLVEEGERFGTKLLSLELRSPYSIVPLAVASVQVNLCQSPDEMEECVGDLVPQ